MFVRQWVLTFANPLNEFTYVLRISPWRVPILSFQIWSNLTNLNLYTVLHILNLYLKKTIPNHATRTDDRKFKQKQSYSTTTAFGEFLYSNISTKGLPLHVFSGQPPETFATT